MIEIGGDEARRLRARAQLIGGSTLEPSEVVRRAGALQGQDLAAVLRAVALRSHSGCTVADVRAPFDDGRLVRGWPMRGTLFALAPEDLAGFASLNSPRMQTTLRSRRAHMGVTDEQYATVRSVTEVALDQRPHTRAELAERWREAGVPGGPGLDYHFTSTMAIDGVLGLGPFDGREQLVVRLAEMSEAPESFVARVARAFFEARGPATLDDFAWWTKLPKALLRAATAEVEGIEEVSVEGRTMLLVDRGPGPPSPGGVVLLPGFDEWVLGYQDRSLVASPAALALVSTSNGIFRPTVLVDGRIVGTWRPGRGVTYAEEPDASLRSAVDVTLASWPFG